MIRPIALAAAALLLAAAPLRAQGAQRADSAATDVRVGVPIVVTAEAPARDLRTLTRGNRFLERELRRYDAQEARLQATLDSLRNVAATRERAIDAMNREAASMRAARLELEARVQRLEAARKAPDIHAAGSAGVRGGGDER